MAGKHDEPEGGWEVADRLETSEIISLLLCRYTAWPIGSDLTCPKRGRVHADVDCVTVFWSSEAIARGELHADALSAPVVRAAGATTDGTEPLFEEPISAPNV